MHTLVIWAETYEFKSIKNNISPPKKWLATSQNIKRKSN